jgi:DNA-binding NarL/FixJ family response regulator
MEMLLDELGCERPCFKPATHDQLVLALHRSLIAPARPISASPLAALMQQRAHRAEEDARQQRRLPVALLASALPARLALQHLLLGADVRIVAEGGTARVVEQQLERHRAHVLVADASDRHAAVELAVPFRLPLLIAATARDHLPALAADIPLLSQAQGIVDITDEQAPSTLAAALGEMAQGRRVVSLPQDRVIPPEGCAVPEIVARLLMGAGLTGREQQLLWLDAQGWSAEQVADRLMVAPASIGSYWKRVQRKLGRDRPGVREWLQSQIQIAGKTTSRLE